MKGIRIHGSASALENFSSAVAAKDYVRAADIATLMTGSLKEVARSIWERWVGTHPSF